MSDNEIIQAFHLMWGNFPEAVMITQKSREIVAVNKVAEKFGLKPGIKCSSIGKPENHKGCQCNKAVDSGEPVICTYEGILALDMHLSIQKFLVERLIKKWIAYTV